MVDFNVGVVVAAAGSGTRLGGSVPKQYHRILIRALMRDVKDPVKLAGRLEEEATRVLTHARAYLLQIQIPECQLRKDYMLSSTDINKYMNLWAKSVEELNRLEVMFRIRGEVNNNTCNR
uniref:Uncharacterized protein n=1 Tax=Homalodisca liturata TaxID=320908 RepID=A0A1B6HQV0_9HEMI